MPLDRIEGPEYHDRVVRVSSAVPLKRFQVRLSFTDGSERVVDLDPYLRGPIFERVRADSAFFRSMAVDPDFGTLVWPNGADICPDVLYHGRTPAALERAAS